MFATTYKLNTHTLKFSALCPSLVQAARCPCFMVQHCCCCWLCTTTAALDHEAWTTRSLNQGGKLQGMGIELVCRCKHILYVENTSGWLVRDGRPEDLLETHTNQVIKLLLFTGRRDPNLDHDPVASNYCRNAATRSNPENKDHSVAFTHLHMQRIV